MFDRPFETRELSIDTYERSISSHCVGRFSLGEVWTVSQPAAPLRANILKAQRRSLPWLGNNSKQNFEMLQFY